MHFMSLAAETNLKTKAIESHIPIASSATSVALTAFLCKKLCLFLQHEVEWAINNAKSNGAAHVYMHAHTAVADARTTIRAFM